MMKVLPLLLILFVTKLNVIVAFEPLVINTWSFMDATQKAWESLEKGNNYLDALVEGCSKCEEEQCEGTVGYGGSPNEKGETTLDAMVFDGLTINMGAVAAMRRIKNAISVARHVLDYTTHSLIVGEEATQFAIQMGFVEEDLTTEHSYNIWHLWKFQKICQPNNWLNVDPNPTENCGPYKPLCANSINYNKYSKEYNDNQLFGTGNHDTIGMIVIDKTGNITAGTSTNGMTYKIPGRVGDSPIPGAGAYADNEIGAASATGDGDVMMRFLPSFLAVEALRHGKTPIEAATLSIERIASKYPNFFGGIIVVDRNGEFAAACNGMETFPYSVVNNELGVVTLKTVQCSNKPKLS